MPEPSCPSRDRFMAYLSGDLPPEDAESLSVHVDECSACQALLKTLSDAAQADTHRPSGGEIPSMSAAGQTTLGHLGEYKLLDKLGQGGMGTVYKAWHSELDRLVALKVLPEGRLEDDEAISRFRREMKAVGRFDHPNIVRARDAREIDGTYFLVMEYVDGLDLFGLARRLGPLPVADACELARQAALGLQAAHEHGLVHRDVKPSNLMLNREGQLKILDLGLARIHAARGIAQSMTAVGQVMGTPDYMAPEQATDSHTVDIRADVYGLGCTLYELLGGRAPFGGPQYRTAFEKLAGHARDAVPPLREFRDDLPDELIDLLDRMLAKDPDARFATPGEVADAVGRFAQGADPAGLLARAEGRPKTARATAGTDAGAGSTTGRQTARPKPPPWRRPSTIAAGMILLAMALGVALLIASRTGNGDRRPAGTASEEPRTAGDDEQPPVVVPDPSRLPGWIVLSWTRPRMGRPNLWLISPDGLKRKRVTNSPRSFDIHPNFSPDGRRIAFIRGQDPTEPNGVWICDTDGGRQRQLVAPDGQSERFLSPVWISDSLIYYARDPKADRSPDMEIWQLDPDGNEPRLVFGIRDSLGQGGGLVTDVSPDGRQLAVIAQTEGNCPTADVYLTDLQGRLLQELWTDSPDERKDARALWSPDGRKIAWHHNFSGGPYGTAVRYGVGLAQLGGDGRWTSELPPARDTSITPLAWSPDGRYLMCARIHESQSKLPPATVFLMDDRFRSAGILFQLPNSCWRPSPRDFGRLADWAEVPDDALPPGNAP